MQAIVLAAGKGTRMRSDRPKVLHEILGRPMLAYVLEVLSQLGIKRPVVVIGSGADEVRKWGRFYFSGKKNRTVPIFLLQRRQRGTGHAVMTAEKFLRGSKEDILIWPADMPLLKEKTLREFIVSHRRSGNEVSVLSSLFINPAGYGRILRAGGRFYGIREELDASGIERRIQEVHTGVYFFKARALLGALGKIRPENSKKEFYLTDTIEILSRGNRRMEAFPLADSSEAQGINSRADLAEAVRKMKNREIQKHQDGGVTFAAPDQTFVAPGVRIGRDTVIYPWCYIESGVTIGRRCEIGPFAKIRKGTVIADGAVIGSFVEVARSRIGKKVLAKHLAYIGDSVIGDETNVGAGTITANFDGKRKNKTRIGKKVLVGSNTVFVAPVTVGDRARTGAGSVVTRGTKIKKGEVVAGVPARPLKKTLKS